METKNCLYCHKTFLGRSNKRFCSSRCRVASHLQEQPSKRNDLLLYANSYTKYQMEILYRYSIIAGEFFGYSFPEECELGGLEPLQTLFEEIQNVQHLLIEDGMREGYDHESLVMWQILQIYHDFLEEGVEELRAGSVDILYCADNIAFPVDPFSAMRLTFEDRM